MTSIQPRVICFGEILWDVFPTHKVIGGAPLNVAIRMQSFGVNSAIISSIGNDENGTNALKFIQQQGLNTNFIQTDESLDTGHVIVTLSESGSASYEIFKPVAWDNIRLNEKNVIAVRNADVFIFGSLACRGQTSRHTLLGLINNANINVFDVNLRPPDYTTDFILELMKKADFVKLNDEELTEICGALKCLEKDIRKQITWLAKNTQTKNICVTLGGEGAILFFNNTFYSNSGYKVKVQDTVGAGDSFLASLICKLLIERLEPNEALDFACKVGALVASKKGANSELTEDDFMKLNVR